MALSIFCFLIQLLFQILYMVYLNVTIDTQDEKVESSDNVSCKANTEGKATHKNLHENSGKQV
ncbi:hypothetical protein T4E_3259 [Trichinella pseudospiralis]|uniref:Uncharacterized protein n=1 Tax=Trichinella pseudospiralis TaxID=6337 RepID=A0A0V0XV43_TRIPS|nr:hypothetical protein T4E_3259 [Trichinella pseudospiralis]